jgi:hypothetical protein
MKRQPANGSRFEETTALLQQAMATLLQNQALFVSRVEEVKDQMDKRFAQVDQRLAHMEALMTRMFNELPEKVFGFGQAAQKRSE